MKWILIFSLIIMGCSTYPKQRIGIIHDYIINAAIKSCEKHEGLHYIVSNVLLESQSSETYGHDNDYPCNEQIKFRCQDNTLISFDSGLGYCFIQEMQIEETFPKIIKEHRIREKQNGLL